jgi:hypothetical protein
MNAEIVSRSLPAAANYCPYNQLGDKPNIVVDGKAQRATVLTLSHWPWNSTPPALMRDTSTDIVFAYLDSPQHHVETRLVSNSHYDEDGLLSMYALVHPQHAILHRSLMIATSRAGDFAICTDPEAAKLSFVLAAYADPEISPLDHAIFAGTAAQQIHGLYSAMLHALPILLESISDYRHFWQAELDHWQESEAAIVDGRVVIDEMPELDLAIVHIPEDMPVRTIRRYLRKWQRSVHPFAVNNVTACSRIVWLKGQSFEMQYRYESWVQMASRRPLARRDLTALASQLCQLETAGGEWLFEGVDEVAPRLRLAGSCRSSLTAEDFIQRLCVALRNSPPAWDPYTKPD